MIEYMCNDCERWIGTHESVTIYNYIRPFYKIDLTDKKSIGFRPGYSVMFDKSFKIEKSFIIKQHKLVCNVCATLPCYTLLDGFIIAEYNTNLRITGITYSTHMLTESLHADVDSEYYDYVTNNMQKEKKGNNPHFKRSIMKRFIGYAVLPVIAIVGLASCASDKTQFDDAKTGKVDDTAQFVMTNVDGFPNVAFRCFTGPDIASGGVPNGIYTTTRASDNLKIVVNDPQCPGYDSTKPTVGIP